MNLEASGNDARVGLAHAAEEDLSDADVLALTRRAVDAVGGIRHFVRPRDVVVVKPNQTLWIPATEGVTTDPRVVAALVTLAKEAGAGHVLVGDGCGGDLRSKRVLEVTGTKRLAERAGADEVAGFEDLPHEDVDVDVDGERHRVPVPRVLLEAQCVINVPKAKTHFEDAISACVKNWVGVIHQEERPRFMQDPLLWKLTARLLAKVPAHLHVVDGLWAGEGTGPASNVPKWLGCVIAGADPVATEVTTARLMGFQAEDLVFAREAHEIGLGVLDPSRIHVAGPRVEDVAIRAKPSTLGFDHLPVRVLVGDGVTFAGSLGHVKSVAEAINDKGGWDVIKRVYGEPTFMIGAVEDPDFERYVEAGPYFVVDDAALDKYRTDRRVVFIPGHPATHNIFPYVFRRLSVQNAGPAFMKLDGVMNQVESWFHFRSWKPTGEARAVEGKES